MNKFIAAALAAFALVSAPGFAQFGGQSVPISMKPIQQHAAVAAGETTRVAVEVELGSGFHVNSNEPLEQFLIPTELTIDVPENVEVREIVYPDPVLVQAGGLEDPLSVYEHSFHVAAELSIDEAATAGPTTVPMKLRYQACDDQQCFAPKTETFDLALEILPPGTESESAHDEIFASLLFSGEPMAAMDVPETEEPPAGNESTGDVPAAVKDDVAVLETLDRFTVAANAGGYLNSDDFIAFIDAAETGVPQRGLLEGHGPIAMIALILVGGVLLNLTPCVLPLIPINLAIIGAGAQAGSRSRGFVLGSAYGLGMTAVYGILGLIVVLTAGSFGTINASPWFNLGIAILFIVLGLAMFDVITIDFSKWQSKLPIKQEGRKGSMPFAFFMGGVAALLAGACVAPVVIQVIVLASDMYAKGTTIALALPFVLGLGMALPWPIAGAGMSLLPKPGAWMVRVKQAIGVFILGFAAYYGFLAYELFDQRFVDEAAVAESAEALMEKEGWTPSLTHGLALAEAENKPVLVDMWATWCKNCLTMDKTTLKDPAVLERLDGYVKVKFQAEDLEASPAREILERLEGVGLPHYAIVHPPGYAE